jgi:hypothetical protein
MLTNYIRIKLNLQCLTLAAFSAFVIEPGTACTTEVTSDVSQVTFAEYVISGELVSYEVVMANPPGLIGFSEFAKITMTVDRLLWTSKPPEFLPLTVTFKLDHWSTPEEGSLQDGTYIVALHHLAFTGGFDFSDTWERPEPIQLLPLDVPGLRQPELMNAMTVNCSRPFMFPGESDMGRAMVQILENHRVGQRETDPFGQFVDRNWVAVGDITSDGF